mmetsp:Transcript_63859/g.186763  ORF Transcript_63859/g.186763 Transcript_63859/m.186763 type:complete len:213 (+) Transcript_63859:1474-2112(+)
MHNPEEANGVVDDPDPAKPLQPSPDMVRRPEARNLHEPREPCQPRQARDPLYPGNPDDLGAGKVRVGVASVGALERSDDRLECRVGHAGDEVQDEIAGEVVPRDEAHAVHLLPVRIPVGHKKSGNEVCQEEGVHNLLNDSPDQLILSLRVRNVKLEEAEAVQEDGSDVNNQNGNYPVPDTSDWIALVHREVRPTVVLHRLIPPFILWWSVAS